MSAVYGRMRGYTRDGAPVQKNAKTAQGHGSITARLETWEGAVEVELHENGHYTVYTGSKTNPNNIQHEGKINA